jgi:ADP-dependent NAD(P)H-hydrate dehydratase
VIAGLLARRAAPDQAAVWAVYLHSSAGHIMTERMGPLGLLAREVLAEIPSLMARLDAASTPGEATPDNDTR